MWTLIIFSGMFGVLSDILDEAFCRGIIGFEVWTDFCEESLEVCSEPTGASEIRGFSDASLESEHYKISTIAIYSRS